MKDRSNRWVRWAGLLLMATLLAGPAVQAAQEDAQQQGDTEKTEPEQKPAEEKTTTPDADDEADKPEAAVDSSFNTVEDVLAWRGPVRSLWTAWAASAPSVQWRETGTEGSDKR